MLVLPLAAALFCNTFGQETAVLQYVFQALDVTVVDGLSHSLLIPGAVVVAKERQNVQITNRSRRLACFCAQGTALLDKALHYRQTQL